MLLLSTWAGSSIAPILPGGDGQEHGPVFLMEPPSRLVFSNSSGARVSCAAHGFPSPQIAWQLPDGTQLDDSPGLRKLIISTTNVSSRTPQPNLKCGVEQPEL
ncbi:unnamed protein product [Colias eurytheme]|nr:unnamed protein product [Colias eurytheme]